MFISLLKNFPDTVEVYFEMELLAFTWYFQKLDKRRGVYRSLQTPMIKLFDVPS